jgi:hypothetical protein
MIVTFIILAHRCRPGSDIVNSSVPDPDPNPDPTDPHVFWHPDPLVRGMDPDPSISKQKMKENLDSYCFVTPFGLFIFEK